MHILICSPEHNQATGNWVTATRYRHGLEKRGHRVTQCYPPSSAAALDSAIEENQPDLLLLLHAYRSGKPWLEGKYCGSVPTVVMLSGTDVNEGLKDAEQSAVIEQVMLRADALLAHNPLLVEQLCQHDPRLAQRLHYLPPGIELGCAPYALRQIHHIPAPVVLFLCPASIRPVKGVLSLIELFDQLPSDPRLWQLAFCGPILDDTYSRRFFAAVDQRVWVNYLGVVPPKAMPAAMNQVDVVLNNSTSEGLPNALIEAASLGRPILARNILGNRPIVDDGINGLLYHDRRSFIDAAQRLLNDDGLRCQLSQPRAARYSVDGEAEVLSRVCNEVLANFVCVA